MKDNPVNEIKLEYKFKPGDRVRYRIDTSDRHHLKEEGVVQDPAYGDLGWGDGIILVIVKFSEDSTPIGVFEQTLECIPLH